MSPSLVHLAMSLALIPSAPDDRILLDKIVATVNGDIVTLSELRKAAEPFLAQNDTPAKRRRLYRDVIEQLIDERLLAQQIREAKINVTDRQVKAAVEDILRQNKLTRDQLMAALDARNLSLAAYEADVKEQLKRLKLVDDKVRARVVVPDSEVRAEYERRVKDDPPKVKINIAHIMLRYDENSPPEDKDRILAEARSIRTKVVEEQEPFEEVAKKVSQGPTASKGGGLGEMNASALMPELALGVEGLKPGQISQPILTPNGVHVVKLIARRLERSKTFKELRPKIYQELFQARFEKQTKVWLDEVERESAIDIRLDEEKKPGDQ